MRPVTIGKSPTRENSTGDKTTSPAASAGFFPAAVGASAGMEDGFPLPTTLWQVPPPGYGPENGTPCLLALSGGADSRLLLHCLAILCRRGNAPLHLAHVNHGIRGAEADRDEQFCRCLAEEYRLPIHVLHADVPALAAQGNEGLEATARRVRYQYFIRLMKENRLSLLVTAHHADDQAETVLFRLIRGSGTRGLGGIAPYRSLEQLPGAVIWRPLLACSRADILSACERYGLSYVTDSTNADPSYPRNRLRAEVLPVLRTIVPHPEKQILRATAALREDEELLMALAREFLASLARGEGAPRGTACGLSGSQPGSSDSVPAFLDTAALCQAPPPIAKRALLLWGTQVGNTRMWETVHLTQLLHLCHTDEGRERCLSLPGGFVACVRGGQLSLRSQDSGTQHSAPALPADWTFPLWEGELLLPDGSYRICVRRSFDDFPPDPANQKNVYNPFTRDTLTFDTISPYLLSACFWRSRREGDTLLWHGMHRKLRKLQNQLGLPPSLRDRIPLLCDTEGILWHPFLGIRDGIPTTETEDGGSLSVTVEAMTPPGDDPALP